jgi:hypothetical protein
MEETDDEIIVVMLYKTTNMVDHTREMQFAIAGQHGIKNDCASHVAC